MSNQKFYTQAHIGTRGYIALMTVLILSTILAVTTVSAGLYAFISSSISLVRSHHQTARLLADDCIRAGLFSVAKDSTFTIGSSVPVTLSPEHICSIDSVSYNANEIHLHARGENGDAIVSVSASASVIKSVLTVTSKVHSWVETTK